jgi:hypothetical protein
MADLDELHIPRESEDPQVEDKRAITIERAKITLQAFDKKQPLMGTTWRSCFTGKVSMKDIGTAFPDFHLVDLYTRTRIVKLAEHLPKDLYLYRPKPLAMRNWIYHNMFREKVMPPKQPDEADDATSLGNRLLKHVLAQKCIDHDISAGRWSSSMAFIIITLFSCFSGDEILCVSTLIVTFFIIIVTFKLEDMPSLYRYVRPITFLPRIGYTGITFWRLGVVFAEPRVGTLGIVGCILILFALCVDFILGDYIMVISYRYTCHYEVVREIANRVFVVKQIGGAITAEEKLGMAVEQRVQIMGNGDLTCKLIADIEGFLVELQPINNKIATYIHHEILDNVDKVGRSDWRPITALPLDIFNSKTPTIQLLDAKIKEDNLLSQIAAKQAEGRK